mgnify:CR=1 FL=1
MISTSTPLEIVWSKLPEDYVLPDQPVDNINQPSLAAALTESLQLAGWLPETAITATNYGICATVNGKIVVKAPDWMYVPEIKVDRSEIVRSYTPNLQGEKPLLVLEFLSDTEGGEFSAKQTYPPRKFFYYEKIVQVPNYGVFEPNNGNLEVYKLTESGNYELEKPQTENRCWIAQMGLYLGVWQGTRENRQGYWLRWWDDQNNMLLWGSEIIAQERQKSAKLAAKLRELGIDPELI